MAPIHKVVLKKDFLCSFSSKLQAEENIDDSHCVLFRVYNGGQKSVKNMLLAESEVKLRKAMEAMLVDEVTVPVLHPVPVP